MISDADACAAAGFLANAPEETSLSFFSPHLPDLFALLRPEPLLRFYGSVLPFWFLLLALFLPRVALFLAWLEAFRFPVPFPVDAVFWLVLPRVLVLMMIYTRQGLDTWFLIHLLAALLVYAGGSHQVVTRR